MPVPRLSLEWRTWTFSELGYPSNTFRPQTGWELPVFDYVLPASVKEPDNGWWIVTLHLHVELARVVPGESVRIGAATNQVGFADVQLDSVRVGGRSLIRWTTVGIVTGTQVGETSKRSFDLTFSNYLAIPGVVPGLNELEWMAQRSPMLESVTVEPTSSLRHTRLAPAQIWLAARVASQARVGERFPIVAVVGNKGGMPATDIAIHVDAEPRTLRVIGARARTIRRVAHGERRTATFVVEPLLPGVLRFGLSATSNSNQTAVLVTTQIRPR